MSDGLKALGLALPGKVADLAARAQAALTLSEQVRASLPAELGIHLLSASYRDETLAVTMDSAAWCPQVRYGAEALLAQLRSRGGPDFVKLKVKVGRRI